MKTIGIIGYGEIGSRPVLYPTSKIGGHCVVPNANILKKYMNSLLIDGILKYE